tara:strand:- start:425 stop:664 length:240 start_codon:yes stop_codon:yes gene_type:complete
VDVCEHLVIITEPERIGGFEVEQVRDGEVFIQIQLDRAESNTNPVRVKAEEWLSAINQMLHNDQQPQKAFDQSRSNNHH